MLTYDAASRQIRSDSVPPTTDTVCLHLSPSLAILVAHGAKVESVYRNGWSEIDLDIHLDHGPSTTTFAERHPLPPGVTPWRNEDPHYGLDEGLACKPCRQAIAWPHASH